MSNVRVLRLVSSTGEEIVAEVKQVNDKLILTKPLGLAMVPLEDGGFRPSIFPWAPHVAKAEVTVKEEHVIYSEPANDELKIAYAKATGTIATPPQGLVLPK
jgi:hypothetical protein